jgi:hypothetical protein
MPTIATQIPETSSKSLMAASLNSSATNAYCTYFIPYSHATKREGSRPILPSCQNYFALNGLSDGGGEYILGARIRAKRSKSGAISFDLFTGADGSHAAV